MRLSLIGHMGRLLDWTGEVSVGKYGWLEEEREVTKKMDAGLGAKPEYFGCAELSESYVGGE